MLASIKKDTTLLREEPFRTARTLLDDARRMGPRDPRYADYINQALQSFYRGNSLAESARELAVVEFDIALLYMATGKPSDALHWAEKSCESCRAAVDALVSGWIIPGNPLTGYVEDKRASARRDIGAAVKRTGTEIVAGSAVVALAWPALVASPRSFQTRRRKAVAAARDMVSFSNLVEHLTAQARGQAAPPPLEIVEESDQKACLRGLRDGRSSEGQSRE